MVTEGKQIVKPLPDWILVEERFDDYRAEYGAPYYVGWDPVTGRTLWRTWSLSESSCCTACHDVYPGAVLLAVSRPIAEGERL